MKAIWTFIIIGLSLDLCGQQLQGTVKFRHKLKDDRFNFVWVKAKNLDKPSEFNHVSARSDSVGHFKLKISPNVLYRVSVQGPLSADTTFFIKLTGDSILQYTINYPPKICPYDKAKDSGICPEGNHKDNVVPIIYGFMADKDLMEKFKREEILMGGCYVTTCQPNWYCKTHERKF